MYKVAVVNFVRTLRCMAFMVFPEPSAKLEIRFVVFELSLADEKRAKLCPLFNRDTQLREKNIIGVTPLFPHRAHPPTKTRFLPATVNLREHATRVQRIFVFKTIQNLLRICFYGRNK